jgi:hypothetical protein
MTAPEMRTPGGNLADAEENTQSEASVPPADTACNAKLTECLIDSLEASGFAVRRLDGGGFLVVCTSHSRHCPDVRALAGFARQVGS